MSWDPRQYERFKAERARPFLDLLARIPDGRYAAIADLGCGTAELTRRVKDRWPAARVFGIDTSKAMLEKARAAGPGIELVDADLAAWEPPVPLDLVVSNAAIHWIPDQTALMGRLVANLAPGGLLAVQAPNNRGEAAYLRLAELLAEPPWPERLAVAAPQPGIEAPSWYVDALHALGCDVSLWETTYNHQLPDAAAIVEWMKGTTLRPVLDVLTESEAADFLAELARRIAPAYPATADGVTFPFRRLFFVARRMGGA